jgi:hypothetical protein
MEELLTRLYYDPETGFCSMKTPYKRAKAIDDTIKQSDVKSFLQKQENYQVFAPKKLLSYPVYSSVANAYRCTSYS